MVVGIVVPSMFLGGAEKHAYELARLLSLQGHIVHLFVFEPCINVIKLKKMCFHDGIKVHFFSRKNFLDLKLCYSIGKACKKYKIRCLVANLSMAIMYSVLSKFFVKDLKVISVIHNQFVRNSWRTFKNFILFSRFVHLSDHIVFVSRQIQKEWLRFINISHKSTVIHNSVQLSSYDNVDLSDKEPKSIVCVAAFREEKNHVGLLRTFSELIKCDPNFNLYLIGDGSLLESIKDLSVDLGIKDSVKFLGARDDVHILLRKMKFFILYSHSEAFPISIIEAMAAKCCVFAPLVGGIPEIINNGHNGFLHSWDANVTINLLLSIDKDIEQCINIAKNAASDVRNYFSDEEMVKAYQALLLEVCHD